MEHRRDADAIALCREVLAVRPLQAEAMTIAAYAHQRMGQLDEALPLYESLESLQPTIPTWSQWVRTIKTRQRVERITGISQEPASADGRATGQSQADIAEPPPPFSWSGFAGEFLQEHWQKLILCLAVLLIVVSSTFGAHLPARAAALVAGGQVRDGTGLDDDVRRPRARSWCGGEPPGPAR